MCTNVEEEEKKTTCRRILNWKINTLVKCWTYIYVHMIHSVCVYVNAVQRCLYYDYRPFCTNERSQITSHFKSNEHYEKPKSTEKKTQTWKNNHIHFWVWVFVRRLRDFRLMCNFNLKQHSFYRLYWNDSE